MDAQNVISFEIKKDERSYRLEMPAGAPLGEAYEATASFLAEMVRMINEHAEKSQPKEHEKSEVDDSDSK